VSVVGSTVEPSPVAARPPSRSRTAASWLIACCYLLGALVLTARLWADPAGRMQVGDAQDVNLFAWFLRYSATAVSHGHLPALVTTALGAPRGIKMMWNTAFVLPGILLTPVTLLAGPQVSLTIVLTLSIAGAAASMFWVLRRWGPSLGGAALGSGVYGFSPALLNSGLGHYHLALAVLPPLIIDALLRIVTGRGRSVFVGAWMGLLVAAQVFISEEMLVYTAVAGFVLVAVVALGQPRAVPGRIRHVALGLATGAAVTLLISGYPLWVQFRGPLHEHTILAHSWRGNLAFFVDPSANLLFHSGSSAAWVASYVLGLTEALAYLGWPLIAALVAAAVWFWHDERVRTAAVTCAVLELCSVGGGPLQIHGGFYLSGSFLPYHWIQGLPLMAQIIPPRFSILGAGAAGVVLAFALDAARSAAPQGRPWRKAVPAAVAVLAVLPLIPVPYRVEPVKPVPPGWEAAFTRLDLPPAARVLVIPVTLIGHTEVMRWQADTGQPRSMIGGYFLEPGRGHEATFSIGPTEYAAEYLNRLYSRRARYLHPGLVRSALSYWRPAAIVALTRKTSKLGRFLISLIGPPTFEAGRLLVWRFPRAGPHFVAAGTATHHPAAASG
jgi:hypothetical protein